VPGKRRFVRRDHFWWRLCVLTLKLAPAPLLGFVLRGDVSRSLFWAVMPALLIIAAGTLVLAGPFLLDQVVDRMEPGDDDASDGGGGTDLSARPLAPVPPRGGLPLPDAAPARVRVRDHRAPGWSRRRLRDPSREPATPIR
jgi:hypothetical protein